MKYRWFNRALNRALSEDFASHFGAKNQWFEVGPQDVAADPTLADEIHHLLTTSYAAIGGHVDYKTPEDVMRACQEAGVVVYAIDTDDDPNADATNISKRTPFGEKGVASGTDGGREAKDAMIGKRVRELNSPGYYGEVSDAMAAVLLKKGVPVVEDERTVREVLHGKDIEWLGADPTGRLPGNGWYRRRLGASLKNKVMVGFPITSGARGGSTPAKSPGGSPPNGGRPLSPQPSLQTVQPEPSSAAAEPHRHGLRELP